MASLKSMNAGLSNNGTTMNAQTEMTDCLLNACRLAGVDYETALKIKAYMPVSSHLTKPDAGGGEAELAAALADVMSWISNWTPDFIYDAEWPDSRERAVLALASYTQTQKESK
jgi:hypothetical protein